jgi:hypothetical protein
VALCPKEAPDLWKHQEIGWSPGRAAPPVPHRPPPTTSRPTQMAAVVQFLSLLWFLLRLRRKFFSSSEDIFGLDWLVGWTL